MSRVRDKLSFKSELGVFVSLLSAVIILLITHCCEAQLQAIGPSQPVVATLGDVITLPCRLEPSFDAAAATVEWTRLDRDPRFVFVFRDGAELRSKTPPSYRGRTSLSVDGLKHGDVSLRLSGVQLSDEGTYRCFVPTSGVEANVELVVRAASSPVIKLSGIDTSSGAVMLECKSAGWYPEPEVLWLDAEGHLVSAGPTETLRGPDGLYTVSSSVTVEHKHNNTFTCKLQQNKTNQTRETQIQISDEFFVSSSLAPVIIVLACLLCIFAVAFIVFVWKQRQTKLKCNEHHGGEAEHQEEKNYITTVGNNMELQSLVKGERDTVHVSDMMKNAEKQIENLNRELVKKLGEKMKVLQEVIDLMINKQDLMKEIEQLNALIQQDDAELKENKKEMDTTDLFSIFKKHTIKQARENLLKIREEHEFLLNNTKTVLQTTENMVTSVRERREEVRNLIKQINQELQEAETRREDSDGASVSRREKE